MGSSVRIENELPRRLLCTGKHFAETRKLDVRDLTLFIERDVRMHLAKLDSLDGDSTVSLVELDGLKQIRVAVTVSDASSIPGLTQDIEEIVWSYNQQVISQHAGQLKPAKPKFQFRIEIESNNGGGAT